MRSRPGLPDLVFGPNYIVMPFEVPKPGTPVQAFVCASRTSKNVRAPLAIGERFERKSGFIAGNEPVVSLWDCDEWPFHVYEIVVDPDDLFVGRGEMLLKTAAFRVVREVPLEEVFGPRAGELGPIFDDIRTIPWLVPKGPPDPDVVDQLVREVYATVAEHRKVRPLPAALVEDWTGACALDQRVHGSGSPAALITVAHDTVPRREEEDEDALSIGRTVLRCILLRQSYTRAWEAAWEAAFNAFLRSSMQTNRPGDAKAARRTWANLRDKIADRHDRAREAALRGVQRMLHATIESGSARRQIKPAIADEILAAGGHEVATDAWNFSHSALNTAVNVMEAPIIEVERSPARPLLDLFRMGLWPIGEVDDRYFLVYSPRPASPR